MLYADPSFENGDVTVFVDDFNQNRVGIFIIVIMLEFLENINEHLHYFRKSSFLKDFKIFDLNMNQNTISRYENLEREADYETLIKLADYFDVSLDYLLGRKDYKK